MEGSRLVSHRHFTSGQPGGAGLASWPDRLSISGLLVHFLQGPLSMSDREVDDKGLLKRGETDP